MLTELRTKSQITIPKEIVASLGLSEGDKLNIYEKDGIICIEAFQNTDRKREKAASKQVEAVIRKSSASVIADKTDTGNSGFV